MKGPSACRKADTCTSNSSSSAHIFGLDVNNVDKYFGGLSLPPFIEDALIYLSRNGINSVGIFRKSGVKSRIAALRKRLENSVNYRKNGTISINDSPSYTKLNSPLSTSAFRDPGEDFCVYDVADMVKMWLREIKPRPLITKEVIAAYKDMVANYSSVSEFAAKLSVLLTDSQRIILQIFIYFLSRFSTNSHLNQMNSQNLAICFTPSLCECDNLTAGSLNNGFNILTSNNTINTMGTNGSESANGINDLPSGSTSSSASSSTSSAHCDETRTIYDAQKCLQYLIENYSVISYISVNSLPFPITSPCKNHRYNTPSRPTSAIDATNSIDSSKNCPNGCISNGSLYRSTFLTSGNVLPPVYESNVIVNAPPCDILKRILYQRSLFDPTIIEWRILEERPEENMDIFEFKVQTSKFLSSKTFTIERRWVHVDNESLAEDMESRSFCFSLKKMKAKSFTGIILHETGYLYDSRWKIGSHGKGRCQLEISIASDLR